MNTITPHVRPAATLALALSTAVLLGGCGGGSSSPAPTPAPTPPVASFVGVTLTGTAATGAALAGAKVEAKCGTVTGTATSAADGSYALKIDNAALPCLLRATSADAATVLHSVAEGTGAAAATANITPVSELVVAKAVGSTSTPAAAFVANTALTAAQLTAAKTAVIAALKPITDLSGIDPLNTAFKAANGSVAGDATDKKLDALMAALATGKTTLGALATAVLQAPDAAAAAAAVSAAIATPPVAACPGLRSGVYVSIGQRGNINMGEHTLNLSTLTITDDDGTSSLVPVTGEACRYTVRDKAGSTTVEVAFGAAGVGSFVSNAKSGGSDRAIGLLFPKQGLALADLLGNWNVVALDRDGGPNSLHQFGVASVTVAADGTATFQACTSVLGVPACTDPALKGTGTFSMNTKGQFVIGSGSVGYGFRTADGTQMLVSGKPNGDGMNVFVRAAPLVLPAVGAGVKFWDVSVTVSRSSPDVFASSGMLSQSLSVSSVDSASSSYTRSDTKSFTVNKPINGLRYRTPGSASGSSWGATIGLPIKGVGTVYGKEKTLDSAETQFGISIDRP